MPPRLKTKTIGVLGVFFSKGFSMVPYGFCLLNKASSEGLYHKAVETGIIILVAVIFVK